MPAAVPQIFSDTNWEHCLWFLHPTPMAILSRSGKFVKVNRALVEFLGYSEAELLRLTFQEITHDADLDSDVEMSEALIAGRFREYRMTKRYRTKLGRYKWAEMLRQGIYASDHAFEYFLTVIEPLPNGGSVEVRKTEDGKVQLIAVPPVLLMLKKHWLFWCGVAVFMVMTGHGEYVFEILRHLFGIASPTPAP